jgi:O-antigen ligase
VLKPFLQNKINYFLTLAVIATTVFSLLNLNSWCMILLVLCRLRSGGPVRAVRSAFSNKYFLAFLAFVLVDVVGFFFTHNHPVAERTVEKEASLVAIALVICGGSFAGEGDYERLMTGYCLILAAACMYCLVYSGIQYQKTRSIELFFYHPLTRIIGQNAVFLTVYVIFGLLFLLYHPLRIGELPPWLKKSVQLALILFFAGFIVLLSSKLLLVVLMLLLVNFVFQRYLKRRDFATIAMIGLCGVLLTSWIIVSDNPVKDRYQDLERGEISMVKQDTFSTQTVFNGASIRLLQWRYANEIMHEHDAWLFGVTSGNSQDLLNAKYSEAHLFMGIPHTRTRGFTDYNFHNQYIETTVRTGLVGLATLLYICWLMIELAVRRRTAEVGFTILALLSISAVQSFLTLQTGVFAFVFMPLVLLSSPGRPKAATVAPPAAE